MSDIFEPIFNAHRLQQRVIMLLDYWFPTYLREMQVQEQTAGDPPLPEPRNYTTRSRFDKFPEDQLPLCVVVSSGLVGDPWVEGDGKYSGWFSIGVGLIVSARTAEESDHLGKLYAAAARAILLQHPSIMGIAAGVEWVDESYDELPSDQDRSLSGNLVVFRVLVEDIVTRNVGPREPIPDPDTLPGSDWPTADDVIVDVENVPILEDLQD